MQELFRQNSLIDEDFTNKMNQLNKLRIIEGEEYEHDCLKAAIEVKDWVIDYFYAHEKYNK